MPAEPAAPVPAASADADAVDGRQAFYARADAQHRALLWTRLKALLREAPTPVGVVHRWRHDDVRPYLMESAAQISAAEAERWVLILENPGRRGTSQITGTLCAGLQLIMPGEVAPAHRDTQSALRFVLEGAGAYTAVDGEKTLMQPGDFVITPWRTWHHHGHDGDGPTVWLDGLDTPVLALFGAPFRGDHDVAEAEVVRPVGDLLARYGSGLLPAGFATRPYRSTDGVVFVGVEGRGELRVGDQKLDLGPRDVAVVPGWTAYALHADAGGDGWAVFALSNRVVHEKLGISREQRLDG